MSHEQFKFKLDTFKNLAQYTTPDDSSEPSIQQQHQDEDEQQISLLSQQIYELRSQLLTSYYEYRYLLSQTLKDVCQQSKIAHPPSLKVHPDDMMKRKKQWIDQQKIKEEEEGASKPQTPRKNLLGKQVAAKVIRDRRIMNEYNKKSLKHLQEIDDPDKDIFNVYQHVFRGKKENRQSTDRVDSHPSAYQIKQKPLEDQPIVIPVNYEIPKDAILSKTSLPQNIQNHQYRQQNQQIHLPSPMGQNKFNQKNFLKIDKDVGFQQLSFDVKNESRFKIWRSFDDQHQQIMTEMQFREKEDKLQTMSHGPDVYKNYIEQQNQALEKQRARVKQLAAKANKAINKEIQSQNQEEERKLQYKKSEQKPIQPPCTPAHFSSLFCQAISLYSLLLHHLFCLQHKSFDVLKALYQNASKYYQQKIEFEGMITVKEMAQIIKAALPQNTSAEIGVVVDCIFQDKPSLTFDEFQQCFIPQIDQNMYSLLPKPALSLSLLPVTIRTFTIWIELHYFKNRMHLMYLQNEQMIEDILERWSNRNKIDFVKIANEIEKGKIQRSKKIVLQAYLRDILKGNLQKSQFRKLMKYQPATLNTTYRKLIEQEQLQYYYNN